MEKVFEEEVGFEVSAMKKRGKGMVLELVGTEGEDKVFDIYGYEYGLLFPNNDSPIDFERIVGFLDGLYKNRKRNSVINSIREFARKTIDNRVTLAPVIEFMESNEGV